MRSKLEEVNCGNLKNVFSKHEKILLRYFENNMRIKFERDLRKSLFNSTIFLNENSVSSKNVLKSSVSKKKQAKEDDSEYDDDINDTSDSKSLSY